MDEFFFPRGSGRLGITVDNLSPQLAEYFGTKEGVLVTSVQDDSAGAKAGLKAGDVITSVNGSAIDDPAELRRRLQNVDEGEEFTTDRHAGQEAADAEGQVGTDHSAAKLPVDYLEAGSSGAGRFGTRL